MVISGAVIADGCGSSENTAGRTASAPAPANVSVSIISPQNGDSIDSATTATGVVSPDDATVDVNGTAAVVEGGRFTADVTLKKGDDRIVATAAAGGRTDRSSVAVTQRPSAADRRAAAEKRARARRRKAAREPAAGGNDGSFAMPNEVGKNLQDAQDDVQHVSGDPIFVSHSRDATGQGRFQVLDRDWKVCAQNVSPGATVSAVGHVVFSAVKDYEDCP